jgi:ubiquitin carboxyl-terminal hydrolase 5/13
MKKLAIVEDKYEQVTVLKCWKCHPQNGAEVPGATADAKVY